MNEIYFNYQIKNLVRSNKAEVVENNSNRNSTSAVSITQQDAIVHYLKSKGLRLTDCRVELFTIIHTADYVLSSAELEKLLPHYDRVTIYRTLQAFVAHQVIHCIADNNILKYGVNEPNLLQPNTVNSSNAGPQTTIEHVHFKCTQCARTLCLPDVPLPHLHLPEGFTLSSTHLLAEGICNRCSIQMKS